MHLLSRRPQLGFASHPSLGGWNHVWTTVGWKLIRERLLQCWSLRQDHGLQQSISGSILMALKLNLLSKLACPGSLSMTPCPGLITSTLFAAKLAERLESLDGRFVCWPPCQENIFYISDSAWLGICRYDFSTKHERRSEKSPSGCLAKSNPLRSRCWISRWSNPSFQWVPAYQHCWSMDRTICLLCSPMCETRSSVYVMCETPTASSPPLHQRTGEFLPSVPGEQSCWSCIFFRAVLHLSGTLYLLTFEKHHHCLLFREGFWTFWKDHAI